MCVCVFVFVCVLGFGGGEDEGLGLCQFVMHVKCRLSVYVCKISRVSMCGNVCKTMCTCVHV